MKRLIVMKWDLRYHPFPYEMRNERVFLMDTKDLLSMYSFHDMPVNYILLDEDAKKIVMNIDYFSEENHDDIPICLNISFLDCLLWELIGDTAFINHDEDNVDGTILKAEQYAHPNYTPYGVEFFIEIDNYVDKNQAFLTLIAIPQEISITKDEKLS